MSSILCKSKPKTDTVGSASPATDWWYLLPDAKSDPRLLLFSWIASVHCKTGNSVLEATCSVVLLLQTYQHCTHRWASCADALICGGCDATSFNLGAWHSLWRFRMSMLADNAAAKHVIVWLQPTLWDRNKPASNLRPNLSNKTHEAIAWHCLIYVQVYIGCYPFRSGKRQAASNIAIFSKQGW